MLEKTQNRISLFQNCSCLNRILMGLLVLIFSAFNLLACKLGDGKSVNKLVQLEPKSGTGISPTPTPIVIPSPLASPSPTGSPIPSVSPTPSPQNSPSPTAVPVFIFLEDPLRDSNNPSLDPYGNLSEFKKNGILSGLDNSGLLSSRYLTVDRDEDFPEELLAQTTTLEFEPSDPKFAQVNAYYHAQKLLQRVKDIGFPLPAHHARTSIDAHCGEFLNAYYSSYYNLICLGYTGDLLQGKMYSALDADVIIHETGHLLTNTFSNTDILFSHPELIALNEGTSDFWANTTSNRPSLAAWFTLGIELFLNSNYQASSFLSLRDSSIVKRYPEQLTGGAHSDGGFWASTLWALRSKIVSSQPDLIPKLEKTVIQVMRSIQLFDGLKHAASYLREAAPLEGISLQLIDPILNERGLLRNDNVSSLQISTLKPVYVFDDPYPFLFSDPDFPDIISYANCNGRLDADEDALIFINLQNIESTHLGNFTTELTSDTPLNVLYIDGYSSYIRMLMNQDFVGSLPTHTNTNISNRRKRHAALNAAFFVRTFSAQGTHRMHLTISSFNSITNETSTKTIDFDLVIGGALSSLECEPSDGTGAELWFSE